MAQIPQPGGSSTATVHEYIRPPLNNLDNFFLTEFETISELFQTAKTDSEWKQLWTMSNQALLEPRTPLRYRIEYHLFCALQIAGGEEHLRLARMWLDTLRQKYQDFPDGLTVAYVEGVMQYLEALYEGLVQELAGRSSSTEV